MVPSARVITLIAGLFIGGILYGEVGAAPREKEQITDAMVSEALTFALRNIHLGRCEKDTPCVPATENELMNPPLSIPQARAAMQVGTISGVAERCGMDWQSNFFAPLMKHFRHKVGLSQRQLALISLLHGMRQSMAYQAAPEDMCTSEFKKALSSSSLR